MKKIIAIIGVLVVLAQNTYGQVDTRSFIFSIAPQISVPVDKFKESNKPGFGGNFIGQVSVAEKLKLLATLGGSLYRGKTYDAGLRYISDYPSVGILYLRAGVKFFVTEAIFLAANAGVARVDQPDGKLGLTYAPQIGCELGGVDLFLKYDVVPVKTFNGANVQALGFCIGYRF